QVTEEVTGQCEVRHVSCKAEGPVCAVIVHQVEAAPGYAETELQIVFPADTTEVICNPLALAHEGRQRILADRKKAGHRNTVDRQRLRLVDVLHAQVGYVR